MIVAALAVAVPATAAMGGASFDRVTGGGQVIFDSSGGAGNTIAFSARQVGEGADGEVQYVNREGGVGSAQRVVHGDVECLRVDGNRAEIAGRWNDEDGTPFHILVVDNGPGGADDNYDIVTVTDVQDPTCDQDDDDDDGELRLARGNSTVYDYDAE